jgi:acyl-CoA reductase-like NAD-dependent aldehyde dehydrogenase
VYKAFVDACVAEANKLKMGNPLDVSTSMGPMAQPHHGAFVEAQVSSQKPPIFTSSVA